MKKNLKKLDLNKKYIVQLSAPEKVLGGRPKITDLKNSCQRTCSHVTRCVE